MQEQNIQMQAWSPLAAGASNLFSNELLIQIAQKHEKSIAQVILRWLIQRGIVPIVKSANPVRMRENIDIFDFELTTLEMQKIATLDTGHTCFGERKTPAQITDFLNLALKYQV